MIVVIMVSRRVGQDLVGLRAHLLQELERAELGHAVSNKHNDPNL